MSEPSLQPNINTPETVAAPLPLSHTPAPQTGEWSVSLLRAQRTIMVVEDEVSMNELFHDILHIHNHHVISASTGMEALQLYQKTAHVDLVIVDIILPKGFSGFDLADLILEKNPSQKIVFTSGCAPGLLRSRYRLTEGLNFLPKPFSPQSLLLLVAAQWRSD